MDFLNFELKQFTCYRNIFTATPTQNLFDDLADSDEENEVLRAWENATSGIDHSKNQANRLFQYSDTSSSLACFQTVGLQSRFTDGSYAVWYAALERETSVAESLYWTYFYLAEQIKMSDVPVVAHRRLYKAECSTDQAVDLRLLVSAYPALISNDHSFCRSIGRLGKDEGVDLFQYSSVRKSGGCCVAVFEPKAIISDQTVGYFKFIFHSQDRVTITDSNVEVSIPESWKKQ